MRKLTLFPLVFFCLWYTSPSLFAQNLVVNPGFEINTGCPTTSSQITRATPWQASRNSPEYMHTCGANQFCVLPTNFWGNEPAAAGNASMGGLFYGSFASSYLPDLREFFYGNLTSPLVVGQTYYVSFKANLADKSSHAVNNLGVQFTSSYNSNFPLNNMAHVYSATVVSQKNGYADISGSFVATSAYTNIMLGNFFMDANTIAQSVGPVQIGWNAYYFLDEICVSPTSGVCSTVLPAEWGQLQAEAMPGMRVKVSWETLNEKNTNRFEVERSLDGINFTKINEEKAAENSQENLYYSILDQPMYFGRVFYRVRLIDQNGSTHTSKIVETVLDESISDFFQASPNPMLGHDLLTVYLDREVKGKVLLEWIDGAGRILKTEARQLENGQGRLQFQVDNLSPGVYQLKVTSGNRCRTQPLIILE